MTKDKALELALEAWQTSVYGSESHHKAMLLAMTNMAQTLAAQPATVQEPLEYWNAVEGWVKIDEVREHFDSVGCGTIYKNAGDGRVPLTAAQPAPVQEPIKWTNKMSIDVPDQELYTTPPAAQRQWQSLTDEEILKLAYPIRWQEVDDFEADKAVNFAQMVEAKLKAKNT